MKDGDRTRKPGAMRCYFVIALILIFGLCGAAAYVGRQQFSLGGAQNVLAGWLDTPASTSKTPRTVRFVVKSGETASEIADELEQDGLIGSAWQFSLIARLSGDEGRLAAGEYQLNATMRPSEIIALLREGRQNGFTIIEGWRIAEIADALQRRGLAQRDEFIATARVISFPSPLFSGLPADASLEGYLFPDTYQFVPGTSSRDLIRAMLDNFDRRFTPEMRQLAADQKLSIHQVMTLASIVEREAVVASERPRIAGVFFNRRQVGMPLQTDPTVQFAVAGVNPPFLSAGYWKRDLTVADLAIGSPYNTYQHTGLPPGPIANPGLSSIQAVLQPEHTSYLYFVAKPDGSHAFATTLEEHNQNVKRYQEPR